MTTRIDLAPKAGFCIKSSTAGPGTVKLTPSVPAGPNTLEPATPNVIPVLAGLKVFINIAWDAQVPAPPEGSEDAIQKAMQGEGVDENNTEGWYVPVIVSNARQDKDKAGSPSLVFDCIYNASLKSRTLRDSDFKIFLVELALQRIEAQTGLALSRSIGTPNIASKGKLLPRTVQVPNTMIQGARSKSFDKEPGKGPSPGGQPLIQEVFSSTDPTVPPTAAQPSTTPASTVAPTSNGQKSDEGKKPANKSEPLPGLRGILKKSTVKGIIEPTKTAPVQTNRPLEWSWKKEDSGRIRINFEVPGLASTLPAAQKSTLDVETRRIILSIQNRPTFDLDLSLSDAQIASQVGARRASNNVEDEQKQDAENHARQEETTRTLMLKRQRDFDVEGAKAEWRVGTEKVVVWL